MMMRTESKRPTAMLWLAGCVAVLGASLFGQAAAEPVSALSDATPPVNVRLQSPWHAPPLLQELLESAHREEPDSFFALIDHLLSPADAHTGVPIEDWTDEQLLATAQRTLDRQGLLAKPGQRQTWNASLALRAELPKVAAFWQLYNSSGLDARLDKHLDVKKTADCQSWVDFDGQILCSASEVKEAIERAGETRSSNMQPLFPPLSAIDHVFQTKAEPLLRPSAVLYADPFSANFYELHTSLKEQASKIQYILRWKPMVQSGQKLLSGYDAYLDLKKVDYLVIDDRKLIDTGADQAETGSVGRDSEKSLDGGQDVNDRAWLNDQLHATPNDLKTSMANITQEELQTLGLKAAYAIVSSSNPLRALKQLSQDFPLHAVSLARSAVRPSKSFLRKINQLHQTSIEAGGEDVWLNGKILSGKEFQPFGLLSAMREERELMRAFASLGLSAKEAYGVLTSKNVSSAYLSSEGSPPPFFDATDRFERKAAVESSSDDAQQGAITYWNDLEAIDDLRYAHWPVELFSLLRPLYPGSFPMIRRNVFNVILALDLSRLDAIQFLSDQVQMATSRVAVRWGVVPLLFATDEQALAATAPKVESESVQMAKLFLFAVEQLGTGPTAKWLRRVAAATSTGRPVDARQAGDLLDKMLHVTPAERQELMGQSDLDKHLQIVQRWTRRLRAGEHKSGSVFVNGQHVPFHPQIFQSILQLVSVQLQTLAPAIYYGQIDDEEDDVSTFFYDQPTTFLARSSLLFPPDDGPIKEKAIALVGRLSNLEVLLEGDTESAEAKNGQDVAVWVFGNLDTTEGKKFVDDVRSVAEEQFFRFGIVKPDDQEVQHLGVSPKDYALLINGKLIHGFAPGEFEKEDYAAIIFRETQKVKTVREQLPASSASQVSKVSSIVESAYFVDSEKQGFLMTSSSARSSIIDEVMSDETSFSIGNPETATLKFSILIDPLGKSVQKWSGVMEMLAHQADVHLRVILNPNANLTEMPLKRFYRSSAPYQLVFDDRGQVQSNMLSFHQMPQDAVLTMGLESPPTWLTMPVEAIYDLDNIRLRDAITPNVVATYDLKYILIEGHARDETSKRAPRGLQLVLETFDGSQTLDTIVMANLAYFQFRASPGLYQLRIRQGRSDDLYEMVSVGNAGWDSPTLLEAHGENSITLDTFQGLTLYPRVAKRKGREQERLVEDEEATESTSRMSSDREGGALPREGSDSIWHRAQGVLASTFGSKDDSADRKTQLQTTRERQKQADINVFTVASGHLYERMTYIMILSTIKNTQHTVKFWFIENFLSPSFKSFLPFLAQAYGFDFELITYAWPHWLRGQSEKQRSIWGMKVLFLDVLFPLDLTKVIFVDADQIVRADLMELNQVDLHGAPYGFAPMGNDSYDMDNFRFWETGYWNKFLRGKPYPISALFVVDLNRFRLVAAGDKLRGHYQALSADPNSLSNLDQDLVASMIHSVPIFSLPREWLWCETWCSWDWYDKAKSIDLCSNPKTHEPKLDRARRQIPEWVSLDEEVAAFARSLEEQGKLGANVVAASSTSDRGRRGSSQADIPTEAHADADAVSPSQAKPSSHHDEL